MARSPSSTTRSMRLRPGSRTFAAKSSMLSRQTSTAPAPGCPALRPTPPARWRCRSPTTRSASASRAPTSGGRTRCTRRNLLISNDAEAWYDGVEFAWDKRFSHGAAVPGRVYLQQLAKTRRRRRRSSVRETATSRDRTTPTRARSRGSTLRIDSPSTAATGFRSSRIERGLPRAGARRLDGVGRRQAHLRHAVHRDRDRRRSRVRRVRGGAPRAARSVSTRRPRRPSRTSQQALPRTAFRPATFGDSVEDLVPRNSFYGDGLERVDLVALEVVCDAVVRRIAWTFDSRRSTPSISVQFGFPTTDVNTAATFGVDPGRGHLLQPADAAARPALSLLGSTGRRFSRASR